MPVLGNRSNLPGDLDQLYVGVNNGLKQLRTAGAQLGLYTQQCYVITVPPSRSHTAIVEASDVHVVSLPGYTADTSSLSAEDEQTFVKAITSILKV